MARVSSRLRLILRVAAVAAALAIFMLLPFGTPAVWAQEEPPPITADLAVTKSGPATANLGDNVTYTLTISNNGPDAAANARLIDVIPAGMTFVSVAGPGAWPCTTPTVGAGGTVQCTNAAFAAGGSATFTLVLNIPAGTAPGTVFTNAVTGLTDTVDANEGNNDAFVVTSTPPAPQADLAMTKTGPDSAAADTNITYTLTASNSGPDAASNVQVIDALPLTDPPPGNGLTFVSLAAPAGWSCTTPAVGSGGVVSCSIGSFAAGASAVFTLTAHIPAGTPDGSNYTNRATISSSTADLSPENDTGTAGTTVVAPTPDFAIAKTHSGNAFQGQTGFTYTITVSNVGTGPSSGTVTVTDTLPAGMTATAFGGTGWTNCTLGATPTCDRADALAAGASYPPITLTVNVASDAPATVTNTATVANGGDVSPANDSASDPTTVTAGPEPDLAIAKTHSGNARQGQTGFTYTITVNNVGSAPTAGTVTVTDTVPAGMTATAISGAGWSCTVGATSTCTRSDALASGAAYPAITLTVNVASDAPPTVTNTATVSGGGETITSNNSASDPTTVTGTGPDLAIAKTHSGNARQGQVGFTYTITVSNVGTVATSGAVSVSDPLPAGLTATAISGAGWTCTVAATSTCTRSDALAAGAAYPPITLTVTVAGNAPASITNTATVSGGGDTSAGNNTASDQTTVRTRQDPTKDPDVVGLVNAQIATALRFANSQITNFNQRLESLHDENGGGDQQGINFGSTDSDTCQQQMLVNPFLRCPTPGTQAAVAGTDALAYGPGDRAKPIYKAQQKPVEPRRRDVAFWSSGYVSFGSADPTGQRSGIDFTTSGLTVGADYRFNRYFVGGAGIGYGRDTTKIGVNGTRSQGESISAALYGSLHPSRNFFIDAVAGYGALSFNSRRFVVDDANFVFGDRTGSQAFGSLTTGYTYRNNNLLLSPYARINGAWLTLDSFTELGGPGALIYSKQTANFLTSVLGLRGKYTYLTDWGAIAPRFRIEYNHDFRGNSDLSLRYADLLGPTYILATGPAERDRMTVGLGVDLLVGNSVRLAGDYQYDVDFLGAPWHRFKLKFESRF